MDKQHIISEIKRTAEENGSIPLGKQRFYAETGIAVSEWYGKYWVRWGDAVAEAGYTPNTMRGAYEDLWLIEKFITLIREIGRFPVEGELRLKAREDNTFPSHNTFRRLGKKAELARRIAEYCRERSGYDNVIDICEPIAATDPRDEETTERDQDEFGYVYLIRSGHYYKIGRSKSIGRREYELAIQLPEEVTTVHTIKTDDPVGIEAYWHRRFGDKRKKGEWFELTRKDVAAFKRRKFM